MSLHIIKGTEDEYTITKQFLGGGAFGSVWKGLGSQGNDVAIKQIVIQENVKGFHSMIKSEVEIMKKISKYPRCSPYIACFYEFIDGDRICYIVMELVQGKSLEKREIPEKDISSVFLDISLGLSHIHNSGILHRDIKPENIILTPQGNAKIVDLGVGCTILPADNIASCIDMAGTLTYIDPRAFIQVIQEAEKKSDIFSLGMTMLEIIYQDIPYFIGSKRDGMIDLYLTYKSKILKKVRGPKYITDMLLDMINPTDAEKRPDINKVLEVLKSKRYDSGEIKEQPEKKLDTAKVFLNAVQGLINSDIEDELALSKPEEYAKMAKSMLRRKGVMVPDELIKKLLPEIKTN